MFVPTLGNDNRGGKSRGRGGGGRKVEGEHGPRRSDGVVSRVTSQLSSRRNPRPYLFAIYAHLERNLGRAPTAPPTASIRRKNVSLGYVRPPFPLSLSVVAGKGRQNRFPKFPRGPPMAACIDSQRCDYTRTPSSLFTDSFRSTRIRHAFSTRPLYSVPFRPFPSSPISENNGHCPLFLPLRF